MKPPIKIFTKVVSPPLFFSFPKGLTAVKQLVCEYCPKKNVCNETVLCSPAEPDKNTHCYASWKNGTDGVELVMKGCWLDHESCYNKMECVASGATANIYFCCCEGEMCNQNFSYRAPPTPTEPGKMRPSFLKNFQKTLYIK